MKKHIKMANNQSPNLIKIAGVTAIIVIALWLINWFVVGYIFGTDKAGQFGDRFGATTSLFGGITIIGLLLTIFLQRQEIQDGKKEFKHQNRTLRYQRFESTFFNMLQLHSQITVKINEKVLFESIVGHCQGILKGVNNFNTLQNTYQVKCQSLVRMHMYQYIRNFQKTVELVYQFKTEKKTIEKYLGIYFAQMSQLEMELICYHYNLKDTMHPEYFVEYKELFFSYLSLNEANHSILETIRKHFDVKVPYDTLLGAYTFSYKTS
jgi:hypothetical protein